MIIGFFSKDNPQLQAYDALQQTYTKNDNLLFVVAPKGGNVFNSNTLALIEELTTEAWQIPYSSRVDSLTNFQHSYAAGDDLVIEDLVVDPTPLSGEDLHRIRGRAQEWLKANAPSSMWGEGSGLSMVFAKISERNIEGLLNGSVWAVVLITITLIISLRSVKMGLLSLLPNVVPLVMALGVWSLLVGRIGLATSAVVSMSLGIVVDDTVHFLSKYLRGRREQGMSPAGAISYAFATTGQAMWITSAALVAGFLMLTFSKFELNSSMGMMVAITIFLALIADYFFLPSMLMMIEHKDDSSPVREEDRESGQY